MNTVDAAMAAIVGFNPENIPLASLALKQGLALSQERIELAGSARDLRLHFVEPRSMKSLEDRVPKWIAEFGQNTL